METVGGERVKPQTSMRQVLLASFVGSTLEWYDYLIYGTAAALVFPALFFPDFSPVAGTLASFATFGVGFVARPVGGAIFGHYGDKIGRKAMLVITLLIMGVCTFFIGLLPTYDSIGVTAPLLLVFLRLIQGLAIGGEWSGAVLMAVEHSTERRRGFHGSWPQVGNAAALILSTGAFAIFSALPEEQFLAWGWRVPFLLSIVLVIVGLYVRLRISETPAFERVVESGIESRAPLAEVLRRHPKNFFLAMGSRLGVDISFYIFLVYSVSYVTQQLGLSSNTALVGLLIGSVIAIFTMPAFGALSDRLGQRPVYVGGLAFLGLFAFPFFWMLDTGATPVIWLALILGYSGGIAAAWGPFASFMARLFDTRVRYSGTALSFQIAGIFGGALAPFIAVLLYEAAGGPALVAAYMAAACALSVICSLLISNFPGDAAEQPAPVVTNGAGTLRGGT